MPSWEEEPAPWVSRTLLAAWSRKLYYICPKVSHVVLSTSQYLEDFTAFVGDSYVRNGREVPGVPEELAGEVRLEESVCLFCLSSASPAAPLGVELATFLAQLGKNHLIQT